jgi:hypothetical protein
MFRPSMHSSSVRVVARSLVSIRLLEPGNDKILWLTYYSIDVKELRLYQQIVLYVIPVVTNMAFVNILVVVVRLYWFEKHFKARRE